MEKIYRYFISYAQMDANGRSGYGSCQISAESKFKNLDELISLGDELAKKNGAEKIVILYYRLFDE